MRSIHRITLITLTFQIILFCSVLPSFAVDNRFMVSPAKLEVRALQNGFETKRVRVTNFGDAPLRVTTHVADYSISKNNAFIFHQPGHSSYSAAKWISLDRTDFVVPPKQIEEVYVKVSIPEKVEPGGHYAAVLFQTANLREDSGASKLNIVSRLAVLVLASTGTEDQISRGGDILRFRADNPSYGSKVDSEVIFHNAGNVHLTLKGDVVYKDMFGKRVDTAPLPEITALPNTDRLMSSTWDGPVIGRFSAVATIRYGPNLATFDTKKVSKEVIIWIVPWKPMAIAAGALVGILLLKMALRKRKRKRSSSKSLPDET